MVSGTSIVLAGGGGDEPIIIVMMDLLTIGSSTARSEPPVFLVSSSATFFVSVHGQPGSIGNPWGPVVDGQLVGVNYAFLPDHPRQMRRQGRMRDVKVLAGMNMDDGSYFIRAFRVVCLTPPVCVVVVVC